MRSAAWFLPVFLMAVGCSSGPADKAAVENKTPAAPAEPVTGRHAFQQMYPTARAWAADALPIQLTSVPIDQVKGQPGKAGAWQCTFVSASKQKSKTFTYSVVEAEGNLHQGVFSSLEDTYTGPRGQERPFAIQAIHTDSDEAYNAVVKKSADFMKTNPKVPVIYLLEQTPRFPDLAWRVIWGESVSTSQYSAFVDATTGAFLEKVR